MIQGEGLGHFYDLRSNSTLRPVRSVPFEARDFGWLKERAATIEEKIPKGDEAEGDFSLEGLSCVGCVWLVENIYRHHHGAHTHPTHTHTWRRSTWK